MSAKKKYPRRFLLITLLFLSVITLGICISFLWLRDSSYLSDEISTILSEKLNIPVSSEKIELGFFPLPSLTITELNLETERGLNILIGKAVIFPDILSLATGKVDISKIRLKTINLKRLTGPGNEESVNLANLEIPQLPILSEIFADLPSSQNDLVLVVEDFHHELIDQMEASVVISPEEKKISGKILVRGLKMDDESPLDLIPDRPVSALTASLITADFFITDSKGLKLNLTVESPDICLKDSKAKKISGKKIEATVNATATGVELSIVPFTLDSPELTLAVDFAVDRGKGSTALTFKGKNIQIETTRDAALGLLKDEAITREIFWILRGGFVPEIDVSFNSNTLKSLFEPDKMTIAGSIQKGTVKIPGTELKVRDIKADVTMEKGILHTRPTHGRVVGGKVNQGTLWVDILGDDNDFEGEFDLSADLEGLVHTLKLLLPATPLTAELERCSKIYGTALGTLGLKSNGGDLLVSVLAEKIALNGEYDRIPGAIDLTAGRFTFDEEKIYVENLNASSNLGDLSSLNAGITLGDKPLLTVEKGSGELDVSHLLAWLSEFKTIQPSLTPLMPAEGAIILDRINIDGRILTPKGLDYAIEGSFTDIALAREAKQTAKQEQKQSPEHAIHGNGIENASGRFKISPGKILLNKMNGKIHTPEPISRLTETPIIEELFFPLDLAQGLFEKNETGIKFEGLLKFHTGATLFIDLGENNDTIFLNRAAIVVKEKEVATLFNGQGSPRFKGTLDTDTLKEILKPGGSALNLVSSLTQNNYFTLSADSDSTPVLTTDFLDLNLVLDDQNTTAQNPMGQGEFKFPPFILKTSALKYDELILKTVEARITPIKRGLEVKILNANLCGIDLTGTIEERDNILDLKLAVHAEDKDLKTTLSCLYGNQELIQGSYKLRANLDSTGTMEALIDNLNGQFTVDSPGGRIYKLTLLSRLLSVINIAPLFKGQLPDLEQDGFGYKALTVNAKVKNGRIIFKESIIDGQDMTIAFRGWMDPSDSTLEIIFLVAPFKTADSVIQKIPILKTILKGSLVSIPVKAVGEIDNPRLFLLPPAEVGKGLVGTMQRILEAPFKLIEKLPGN